MRLCLDEKDFHAALRDIKTPKPYPPFLGSASANATTHLLQTNRGLAAIVTLGDTTGVDPIEVYALLVHEAMHIWREIRLDLDERDPSAEFEAYAMQMLARELMQAYAARKGRKRGRG
jgi:hypothetical protein